MIGGILSTLQNLRGGFCPPFHKLQGVLCPPCKKHEGCFVHLCQNEQGVFCPGGVLSYIPIKSLYILSDEIVSMQSSEVCFIGFEGNSKMLCKSNYLRWSVYRRNINLSLVAAGDYILWGGGGGGLSAVLRCSHRWMKRCLFLSFNTGQALLSQHTPWCAKWLLCIL